MINVEIDVSRYEQIQLAVVVVIQKRSAGGPLGRAHTRDFGNVAESTVAVVLKQVVLPEAGYEKIIKAIVVIVTNGDSHAPTNICETRFVRHVSKGAVAIIVVESASGLAAGLHQIDCKRVNEEDIEIAVVVVIEQRHPTAHRLNDVLLIGRCNVLESDAGLSRDVGE